MLWRNMLVAAKQSCLSVKLYWRKPYHGGYRLIDAKTGRVVGELLPTGKLSDGETAVWHAQRFGGKPHRPNSWELTRRKAAANLRYSLNLDGWERLCNVSPMPDSTPLPILADWHAEHGSPELAQEMRDAAK